MAETLYDILQFKGEAGGKAIIDEVLGVCPEVTGIDQYNGGHRLYAGYWYVSCIYDVCRQTLSADKKITLAMQRLLPAFCDKQIHHSLE